MQQLGDRKVIPGPFGQSFKKAVEAFGGDLDIAVQDHDPVAGSLFNPPVHRVSGPVVFIQPVAADLRPTQMVGHGLR